MVLTNGQGFEVYSFLSATEAFTKTTPFTIFFQGCSGAILVPTTNFSIAAVLANSGDSATYTGEKLGFTSTDPTNCPVSGISATYTFCEYPACTGSSVTNVWSGAANTLTLTRAVETPLSTEYQVKVTATFGSTTIKVENVITVSIIPLASGTLPSTCDPTTWNCYFDCNKDDLVFSANITANL